MSGLVILHLYLIDGCFYYGCSTVVCNLDAFAIDIS